MLLCALCAYIARSLCTVDVDINFVGLDSSPESMRSLLFALGLSEQLPAPRTYPFPGDHDPLGLGTVVNFPTDKASKKDAAVECVSIHSPLSQPCRNLVDQAQRLATPSECREANDRVISAALTLTARQVILHMIAKLSLLEENELQKGIQAMGLTSVKNLVKLLRLVQANRIDGTLEGHGSALDESDKEPAKCLGLAMSAVLSDGGDSAVQLMQASSRDLLAAAVGGADFISKNRQPSAASEPVVSDVTVLGNPNFFVSMNLVQTLAKIVGSSLYKCESGGNVAQMVDALAACLFSAKLEAAHRFWALKQLLKVFAQVLFKRQEHSTEGNLKWCGSSSFSFCHLQ